ncbi:hypothetical protein [Phenylobacterium sp.]|uniref:hypothetical protein n=1 Tax=Phenylobacterium sp. TaxID=1871053 RepID=UPI0035AFC139
MRNSPRLRKFVGFFGRRAVIVTASGVGASTLLWTLSWGALGLWTGLAAILLVGLAVAGRRLEASSADGRGGQVALGRALALGSAAIAMLWLGVGIAAFGLGWAFVLGEVGAASATIYALAIASLAIGALFLVLGAVLLASAVLSAWRSDFRMRWF